MHVYYEESCWKVIKQPVRDSLLAELRDSCPWKKIDIKNCSTDEVKTVSLKDVEFDGEY